MIIEITQTPNGFGTIYKDDEGNVVPNLPTPSVLGMLEMARLLAIQSMMSQLDDAKTKESE